MTHSYLNFITLTTGHLYLSPTQDVQLNTIRLLRPWIKQSLKSRTLIPGFNNYAGYARKAGSTLTVTVYHNDLPLCVFGVCPRSRDSYRLWGSLQSLPGVLSKISPPTPPWLAVCPLETIMEHPDALEWLPDFNKSIAWTWMQKK